MNEKQLAERIVALLNEAFESDFAALQTLMCTRVPCNLELANHPSIQIGETLTDRGDFYHLGTLGLINGLLRDGRYQVAMAWEPVETAFNELNTSRLVGFRVVEFNEDGIPAS